MATKRSNTMDAPVKTAATAADQSEKAKAL